MTSEWCCSPFTVPKPPPADQNTIDGWRMVVDFAISTPKQRRIHTPCPSLRRKSPREQEVVCFSVLDLRHGFHQNAVEEGQQTSHLYVHAMWPSPMDPSCPWG